MAKQYLGDGVYVGFDGFVLVLSAENGVHATDTIYLEPQVLESLVLYIDELKQASRKAARSNARVERLTRLNKRP